MAGPVVCGAEANLLALPRPVVGVWFTPRHPRLGDGNVGVLETTEGARSRLSLVLRGGKGGGKSISERGTAGTATGRGLIAASVLEQYWRLVRQSGVAGLSGLTCRSAS